MFGMLLQVNHELLPEAMTYETITPHHIEKSLRLIKNKLSQLLNQQMIPKWQFSEV